MVKYIVVNSYSPQKSDSKSPHIAIKMKNTFILLVHIVISCDYKYKKINISGCSKETVQEKLQVGEWFWLPSSGCSWLRLCLTPSQQRPSVRASWWGTLIFKLYLQSHTLSLLSTLRGLGGKDDERWQIWRSVVYCPMSVKLPISRFVIILQ